MVAYEIPRPSNLRRKVLAAVSIATGLWILGQIIMGLIVSNVTWPITGFTMFRGTRSAAFHADIFVRTRSGQSVKLTNEDFDLPRMNAALLHLMDNPTRKKPPTALPGAKERLGKVIAVWNRRHPADPAVSGVFAVKVFDLQPDGKGALATRDLETKTYYPVRWP